MRKFFIAAIAAVAVISSCNRHHEAVQPVLLDPVAFVDTLDGTPMALYTLKAGDIVLQATNFGARVASIWTPDRNGDYADIVCGRASLKDYMTPPGERFLGACVGPVANRIGNASFTIDGKVFNFPRNDNGKNTLHGGVWGLDMVPWDVVSSDDSTLVLHYRHANLQEGFPGNLDIEMKYAVTSANEFVITYKAVTDETTHVNISNHPFFCLRGESNGSVEEYEMMINASRYTPIDELSIPTGEVAPVEGTPFDFRTAHLIGERIGEDNEQLRNARGYDQNWCLDKQTLDGIELACTVHDPVSGRFLEVLTDQPGLQFYSGNFFDGKSGGKTGKPYGFRSSMALETQKWPDSCNQPGFTSTLLRPGETYTQTCIYRFSVK